MNKNIEVIAPDIWAVRFSLIPFIVEIDYKPDSSVVAYEEPVRVSNDGIIILNKDNQLFEILKSQFPKTMKKKDKQLKKELNYLKLVKNKTDYHWIYLGMIETEMQRRLKRKGLINDGNSKNRNSNF